MQTKNNFNYIIRKKIKNHLGIVFLVVVNTWTTLNIL
jgi:hypothetical protein